jgi:hypothetical protein
MNPHIERLQSEHRRLNRMIDTTQCAARQGEMKALKRLRLRIKDRLARLQSAQTEAQPGSRTGFQ